MATARDLSWKVSYAILLLLAMTGVASSVAWTQLRPPLCRHRHDHAMKINTALLTIHNDESMRQEVFVYVQSEQCHKCDLIPIVSVMKTCTVQIDSRWPARVEIRVYDNDTKKILPATASCSKDNLTQTYQEGGNYSLYIQSPDNKYIIECSPLVLNNDPDDPNIPIYVAIALAVFMVIFCKVCYYVYKKGYIHRFICFWSTESMMSDLGPPNNINNLHDESTSSEQKPPPKKERLKSLDTFRGISIVIMIFVNYGGGKYWFFHHSKWNGVTVADLVFPWFVFIMGTAMVYSIRSQVLRNVPKWRIFARMFQRSCTLFFLGLIINSSGKGDGMNLETFRIPGVLQRFAGTYLITGSIYLFLSLQHAPNPHSRLSMIQDITDGAFEWVAQLVLVGIHLTITFLLPVDGCPSGYLGPGGLDDGGKYFNCTGGAAGLIDRKIFGDAHIYGHPTCTEIYHQTVPYDPEGLLGTLNSCFMCFLGLQAGKIIVMHNDWVKRCQRFLIWSLVTCAIGMLLCKTSLNDGWIPINKNLWSLSFVLILSAMAFFLLMICYILIDVYKVWSGAPFYYAGMNAIALYCGHEFFSGKFPVAFSVEQTHASQLALNMWGATFWVLVSIYLFYKDVFISV